MARLNACGVEADAFPTVRQSARKAGDPRRGLTLRVQADAVPTARPVCEESKATAASIGVAFPHPRIAAPVRAPLRVCGGGSRGYKAASDITRCWPQASCLYRRGARHPCRAARRARPTRAMSTAASTSVCFICVLLLQHSVQASCTRCARLRAIHGLPGCALRNKHRACARAPARRRPPELAHGLDASMRCLSSPSMARRLRPVHRGCARVALLGFGQCAAARCRLRQVRSLRAGCSSASATARAARRHRPLRLGASAKPSACGARMTSKSALV